MQVCIGGAAGCEQGGDREGGILQGKHMCIDGTSKHRCDQCASDVPAGDVPATRTCRHALQADLHDVERLGASALQGGRLANVGGYRSSQPGCRSATAQVNSPIVAHLSSTVAAVSAAFLLQCKRCKPCTTQRAQPRQLVIEGRQLGRHLHCAPAREESQGGRGQLRCTAALGSRQLYAGSQTTVASPKQLHAHPSCVARIKP